MLTDPKPGDRVVVRSNWTNVNGWFEAVVVKVYAEQAVSLVQLADGRTTFVYPDWLFTVDEGLRAAFLEVAGVPDAP